MALRLDQGFTNPKTGIFYEEAILRIWRVQIFGHPSFEARITYYIYGNQEELKSGKAPVYKKTVKTRGEKFKKEWNNWYESIDEAPEQDIIRYIENNIDILGENPSFQENQFIAEDPTEAPKFPITIKTGTKEQAVVCDENANKVEVYVPAGTVWYNSKLYSKEDVEDTSVLPTGYYYEPGGFMRHWVANKELTDGSYDTPIIECGGEDECPYELSFEAGESPNDINVYISSTEDISGYHIQLKPILPGEGETPQLKGAKGGIATDNGYTQSTFQNAYPFNGAAAHSIIGISLSGSTLPSTDGETQLLTTLNFTGDILSTFENYGGEMAASCRMANTEYKGGLPETNFNWSLEKDGQEEVINIQDVVVAIGFLGGIYDLTGYSDSEEHNMSGEGGIENLMGGIQMILDGMSVSDSLVTGFCDTFWMENKEK